MTRTWQSRLRTLSILVALLLLPTDAFTQGLERALITHSSESITTAFLTYGIERGYYRTEGIDLEFRLLRGELAVNSLVGRKEVDYIYGTGTAFLAAVQGLPVRILANNFSSVLFYLMGLPTVRTAIDLKGKKIAVTSLSGSGAASARAALKSLGLDPDRDVTLIVIGAAPIRLAAMESKSVEAAIMPMPWNIIMRKKGFRELIFAGRVMQPQPLTGIAASLQKMEREPAQIKKMLGGFLATLRAVRREKRDFVAYVAQKFRMELPIAEEVYERAIEVLTPDGTIEEAILQNYLEQVRKEVGIKKETSLGEIVDYRWIRNVAAERRK